ncbi:grasp-with-spasm system SPASM domain peptide maturase [Chryseobacterium wangxinyae]|uniref:grasp-with-spasm system SPASM domain peptide maturase n=1 Tax=Chryseobacterium sp. CY350 TaxID=2997336 RepID=UPI0022719336|nr:grasp-with-spasm system SPASM domain peptide maturase [Chryseobacterium sp. CY350]MCY0977976.1 grasp-with-spasm system SPASM domain peptide maturase [Chryseobacterium sp. CY350]WBZ95063.1 grasp-with-spasm system SPASM domain peptide maturase [Chryseobacterium sp. CY350]
MNYFKIFSNCILAKGHTQSVISDLQRQLSETIPNDLFEIIQLLNSKKSIDEICNKYGLENKQIIIEYLDFLQEKEYGFYCEENEYDLFPKLDITFNYPSSISNAVIELKLENIGNLNFIIKQLFLLQCESLTLVFYENLTRAEFYEVAKFLEGFPIRSLEIVCKHDIMINQKFLKGLNMIMQLTKITFFEADRNIINNWDDEIFYDRIYTTKKITTFKFCGAIDLKYFNTNLPKVLEAINHNSCLHKKISIDINGNIKNCPSMSQNFGNIQDIKLENALDNPEFKKYWNLTKDRIEICKDCEFRYICTDCRAYTEQTKTNTKGLDISKPLKCGYNPYTGEWEEWSTNPFNQKPIRHYGLT